MLAACGLPQPDGYPSPRYDGLAIGAEGNAYHTITMPCEGVQMLPLAASTADGVILRPGCDGLPSGLKVTLSTPLLCPVRVRKCWSLVASHSRMVLSKSSPDAMVLPSGLKATLQTNYYAR